MSCMSELANSISFIGDGIAEKPNVFGDIVLTPEQEKFLIPDHQLSLVQAFFDGATKWPNAEVPYVLDSTLSELENLP